MPLLKRRDNYRALPGLALFCCWLLTWLTLAASAGTNSFRFAWLSDTHVGSSSGGPELRLAVRDINSTPSLSFVLISGDITEYGSKAQLTEAKQFLDQLSIPYYLIPGNHDTKWSESGGTDFGRIWPADRFTFEFGGYRFIGLHEGPLMRMGDGHWAPQDLRWLETTVRQMPDTNQPVIFVTHYPVDKSIDNWFLALDLLKRFNTQAILCGHGHANRSLSFETIPGIMGRSNLGTVKRRAGFNVVEIQGDEMNITERLPGDKTDAPWLSVVLRDHRPDPLTNNTSRVDFSENDRYPRVQEKWIFKTGFTIVGAPARWENKVIAADTSGTVRALSLKTGEQKWGFKTRGPIVSTPATGNNRLLLTSTDGAIYCLDAANGAESWRLTTPRPIVACPAIHGRRAFVGSSEGIFRALDLASGKVDWEFKGVSGFVETKPLVYRGKVIFGAWDQHLYALDEHTGKLLWKWKGGQTGVLYSPAACWPVAAKGKVFIVAPDRKMTALRASSGEQLWRTGAEYAVRESLGLSENASRLYVRAMNDFFYAFKTSASVPTGVWNCNAHFGYDINSAMLTEKQGTVFYGTKNGMIFALEGKRGAVRWQHKFGVALINTLLPISADSVVATDTDGRVTLVEAR